MKLFFFPGACSHAVHLALREANADFSLVKVDPKNKTTSDGQSYKEVNPKGYVPALLLDNGELMTEAAALLQYVADKYPDAKLAPARGSMEYYRMLEWLTFISSEVHKSMGALFSADDTTRPNLIKRLETRLNNAEALLGDKEYVTGSQLTVADLYLSVILGWSKWVNVDLSPWPKLSGLRERISARPSSAAARAAENA